MRQLCSQCEMKLHTSIHLIQFICNIILLGRWEFLTCFLPPRCSVFRWYHLLYTSLNPKQWRVIYLKPDFGLASTAMINVVVTWDWIFRDNSFRLALSPFCRIHHSPVIYHVHSIQVLLLSDSETCPKHVCWGRTDFTNEFARFSPCAVTRCGPVTPYYFAGYLTLFHIKACAYSESHQLNRSIFAVTWAIYRCINSA